MSALIERAKSIPRGIQTIREWLGEGGEAVHPVLAQERANICLQCPKNKPTGMSGALTAAMAEAIHRHMEFKNSANMRVAGEAKLGECEVCRCQLALKIHVPISIVRRQMTTEEFEHFPTPCWQRDEKT